MILVVVCSPIAALGAVDLALNATQWPYAAALIAGAIVVIGYNFTARLVIDAEFVTFKRYGRIVWRTPRRGVQIEDGMAGDIPILPAVIIRQNGRKVGFVAKGWFYEAALSALRAASLG